MELKCAISSFLMTLAASQCLGSNLCETSNELSLVQRHASNIGGQDTQVSLRAGVEQGAALTADIGPDIAPGSSRYQDWFAAEMPAGRCGAAVTGSSKSQYKQDLHALGFLNCKRGGFYLDIGANHGVSLSNTFVFDKVMGWTGLCVDPFPIEMENRTCTVLEEVVSESNGAEVHFTHSSEKAGVLGGITDELDKDERHQSMRGAEEYTLHTKTATELLDSHGAPHIIDFASIDVEGSELLVLKGLNLDKYCIRFLTIEHNHVEPLRSDLRDIMEARSYTFAGMQESDDFYTRSCHE